MSKSKPGPDVVLDMLRNMAINRAYKPMSDDELWEQLRKWLVTSGKLLYFDRPKSPQAGQIRTFRCGVCNDSGNVHIRWENGEPVYGPCSCKRKRIIS